VQLREGDLLFYTTAASKRTIAAMFGADRLETLLLSQ
jgi:hypothetical protein